MSQTAPTANPSDTHAGLDIDSVEESFPLAITVSIPLFYSALIAALYAEEDVSVLSHSV